MSTHGFMNRVKMQENRSTGYYRKARKKLRIIVLSNNVNDYDTGENAVSNKKSVDTKDRDIFA
ncbi:MAG TPA: hypothetical protein VH500_19550 [Nitrososphaeraceae archaeon]